MAADILPRPALTPDQPQHWCLDKGYDYARVEAEVKDQGYIPHIRRIGEEKIADPARKPSLLGAGSSNEPSLG